MRRPLKLITAGFALSILATGCGGTSDVSTTGAPEATSTSVPQTSTSTTPADGADTGVMADIGVDVELKVISIGLLADQTGLFSALEADIVAAQSVYWDAVNDAGGINGWMLRYIIEDTNSNTDQHIEKYEQIRDEVAAISLSTGSTANIESLDRYKEDSMLVIPLSWYSGWSIPRIDGGVILEQNTNYCLEAMNILDFVNEMGGRTVALATFGDAYGLDAAAGVKKAVEFYDMELIYDGMADVVPGGDVTPVIQGIVDSRADWTFLATNPSLGAEILAGAVRLGYEGLFTGSVPSYDSRLLDQPVAELYGTVYYQSAYNVAWGEDAEGNNAMMEAVSAVAPDRRPSDVYIVGWNGAVSMHRVLAIAVASGDLTRSGIVSAANSIVELDFGGAAPTQSYSGSPNDHVQRALAIYKPDLGVYLAAGGARQTLSQSNATTGSVLVKDFFIGEMAQQYEFSSPCFEG